jgi:hypothetical protein
MKKTAAVLILVVVVISFCSCSVFQAAVRKTLEERENIPHTDYWQSGIPDSIPRFPYGKYEEIGSFKTTDKECISYMLTYTGVTKEDIEAYGKALKDAGFDVSTMEGYDDYSVMGMPEGSGDIDAMMSPDDDSFLYPSVSADLTLSDGSCFVSITIENTSK